jgi:hypothetical protein
MGKLKAIDGQLVVADVAKLQLRHFLCRVVLLFAPESPALLKVCAFITLSSDEQV